MQQNKHTHSKGKIHCIQTCIYTIYVVLEDLQQGFTILCSMLNYICKDIFHSHKKNPPGSSDTLFLFQSLSDSPADRRGDLNRHDNKTLFIHWDHSRGIFIFPDNVPHGVNWLQWKCIPCCLWFRTLISNPKLARLETNTARLFTYNRVWTQSGRLLGYKKTQTISVILNSELLALKILVFILPL